MAKEALNRIESKKRERIFRTAAAEFARHGYHQANVNSIARRAGIGKGSIYLYFNDKRDLYYSTFKEAARIQDRIFDRIESQKLDPIAKIEQVFEQSLKEFPRYRNMYKMYFDLSATGDERSLAELARILEKRSAEFFIRVLYEGIDAGSVRKDLPVKAAAYVIDCVYTNFLATLANRYQKERFQVFTGGELAGDGIAGGPIRNVLDVVETCIVSLDKAGHAG